ncbi:type I-G CRISPR-associated protein Cas8g1/Csx17 [Sinimarinibacterium thermocellulolyticum]|uniref:Type I-U CRISPR-associated protein Csx17 n=1 Tax=Sinimarinibacterium thermocellulolyticum TaxID=3170016 RepID=A0ABV2A6I1_9GAMM
MSEQEPIDWSKTTFDGSRREQLKRWRALSLRERLQALDRLTAHAERTCQAASRAPSQEAREPQPSHFSGRGRNEIVLPGCTPTPLASYLKALAILRLVAEQAGDPDVMGFWRDDQFVLRTWLKENELLEFFLQRYQPTPIVAPWNGGSGFFSKDNQDGIRAIGTSKAQRFESYRSAIDCARKSLEEFKLTESPKEERKAAFLAAMRNRAPEQLLRWLDASVILTNESPAYPPLLGTGGNDGRLDFTNNFMQRLVEVFNTDTGDALPNAKELLSTALFATPSATLVERSIGQFSPGSAGGPNATSGFEGDARINPWDFVLMLEGAVLFAASAVRRLESNSAAMLSAPFTVRSRLTTASAASLADDADARGEIWMPLWSSPFGIAEVLALLNEGRAVLGTRPARDGLDFARAVSRLGVDRGITAFQRYAFVMRSGKAFLATPLSRIAVRRNPEADLIDELDRREWLTSVQRYARDDKAPNALRAAAARLDAALFALTQNPGRTVVLEVLRQLGRIEALCAVSPKTREAIRVPVPTLSSEWVRAANDGSPEFRISLALAGLSLPVEGNGKERYLSLRPHLAPMTWDAQSWDKDSYLACWGSGPLTRNLAAVLHRRHLEAVRLNAEGELLRSRKGATLADVQRFLDGETDDRRIGELLAGLACVKLEQVTQPQAAEVVSPLPAFALLKPFFTPESLLRAIKIDGREWLQPDRSLRLPAEIPARLASGDIDSALQIAWQRLRALGVKLPGRKPPRAAGLDGPRLLATLTIPLTFAETGRLLRWLDLTPESETPEESLEYTA